MIAWLLLKSPWLSKVWSLALGPLKFLFTAVKKNPIAMLLVLMLVWQAWSSRQQMGAMRDELKARDKIITAQTEAINGLKDDNARLSGSIRQLTATVAAMKPGDPPKIIYVPKPEYITLPGKEIPVIVTRTEHTVETKVVTLQLPGKEIERIVLEAPQSIVATMTALRDIKAGEKFTATFAQLQPGIWQPLVTPDSPIGIEAKVVTPLDRIPTPAPVPSRWTTAFLLGPDPFHPQGATVLTRAEVEYRLSLRLFLRGEAAWHWNGAGASGLLLLGTRF